MRVSPWAPVVVWCAVIFAGSCMVGSPVPSPLWSDWLMRKSAHLTEYAILFLLARRAFAGGKVPPVFPGAWAFLFCVAYAATDEYHQTFVPFRSGEARDVLIDAVGAALASAVTSVTRSALTPPNVRP
ncbi:VanZ family protein [bacterium]|nr:MAG: VanZ family protein [bacterium]